jgi:hypothetical protein
MKALFWFLLLFAFIDKAEAQIRCLSDHPKPVIVLGEAKSINDVKYVRVNIHFMLKSNGTGNFTETSDGDGRSYTGYQYAMDHVRAMNGYQGWNIKANIPPGNSIPIQSKNYYYILNSIHFHRNDNSYYLQKVDYNANGVDKTNVLNIFFSHTTLADVPTANATTAGQPGGYASDITPNSKVKYTDVMDYWTHYRILLKDGKPMDWHWHGCAGTTNHELGHLLTLSHTVRYNGATRCPVGCGARDINLPIDVNCDDGCADTPTAWDITRASGNCTHPACGWGTSGTPWCSSNVMDYGGGNTLTPCQLNKIHTALEGGMRTYLSCEAVKQDMSYCDIGYPYISYFGKKVNIGGCSNQLADVTNREVLAAYFSESLDLQNFEVRTDSEFDVIYQPECPF